MANFWIMKYFLFVLGACSFFIVSNLNAGISYKGVEEETITFVYTAVGIKFSGSFVIKRSQFHVLSSSWTFVAIIKQTKDIHLRNSYEPGNQRRMQADPHAPAS